MGRLIAFDPQTASALVAKTRTAAQLGHGSPLKAALANEGESTLLMRASASNDVLVVNVRRPQPAPRVVAAPVSRSEAPRKAPPEVKAAPPAPQASKPVPARQTVQPRVADAAVSSAPLSAAPAQQQVKPVEPVVPPRPEAAIPRRPIQTDLPKKAKSRDDNEPVAYAATGFLGLEDSPLYEEDLEPQPKKKWWKKILE